MPRRPRRTAGKGSVAPFFGALINPTRRNPEKGTQFARRQQLRRPDGPHCVDLLANLQGSIPHHSWSESVVRQPKHHDFRPDLGQISSPELLCRHSGAFDRVSGPPHAGFAFKGGGMDRKRKYLLIAVGMTALDLWVAFRWGRRLASVRGVSPGPATASLICRSLDDKSG